MVIKMLGNRCLRSIHSHMKEIFVIPIHYVFLEFLWNNYFILVWYELYYSSLRKKNPFDIFCM